jgi:hypothetical protein
VTALATAGADGSAVAPDLVLPPGFDRIGDVVRFEQQVEAGAQGGTAQSAPLGEVDIVQPDATNLAPPPLPVQQHRCARCRARGHNARTCRAGAEGEDPDDTPDPPNAKLRRADRIPCTRCGLRGHVAGDPDRCLYYRGSLGLGGQAAQAGEH